jgi:hypothetical protein
MSINKFKHALQNNGLDIFHSFCVGAYNDFFAGYDASFVLNTSWSKYKDKSLAIIIGNTKQIWPYFVKNCDKTIYNPLDKYVMDAVQDSITSDMPAHKLYFSHQRMPTSQFKPMVSMQHASHLSGLAFYDNKNSYLCINNEYGSWFALRCIVVLEEEYTGNFTPCLENPCSSDAQLSTKLALEKAMQNQDDWREWIKMRETCKVNNSDQWKYGTNQLYYHYTLDKKYIELD